MSEWTTDGGVTLNGDRDGQAGENTYSVRYTRTTGALTATHTATWYVARCAEGAFGYGVAVEIEHAVADHVRDQELWSGQHETALPKVFATWQDAELSAVRLAFAHRADDIAWDGTLPGQAAASAPATFVVRPAELAGALAVRVGEQPLSINSHSSSVEPGVRVLTTDASWSSVDNHRAGGPAYVLVETETGQRFRLFVVAESSAPE